MKLLNAIALAALTVGLAAHAQEAPVDAQPQVPSAPEADPVQAAILERSKQLLLADPQTIIEMRQDIQRNSAARQAPVVDDFTDINQEVLDLEDMFDITLEPDSIVPRIMLARYQSTAVSFVDAFGNPWPIRSISSFLDGLIQISRATGDEAVSMEDPQAGSFTMTALKHGVVGNITVYLHDMPKPINILLQGKGGIYHREATVRVNEVGPQTDVARVYQGVPITVGAPANEDLNNALYGIAPAGSMPMVVEGGQGKAWIRGDSLFVQTPMAIFSPRPVGVTHGNGNYRAYELPLISTVMGTNNHGQTVILRVKRSPASDMTDGIAMGVSR